MNRNKFKVIYTICVFVALAAFDNIVVGLFPPLFSSIANSLNINVSLLGTISAINILVTSVSAIYWGYLAGKYNRKKLIIIGTILWSASVFFTSLSNSYLQLFISQIITGIGLGCIASVGYSVLTDYIPYKYKGMLLSLWGMSQGFGGIVGALMASLIATVSNWRRPFEIVSFIGLLLIVLYIFIEEPSIGESEPELKELIKKGYEYNYNIEFSHLYEILSKKSNILLFFQAFFMNISTGTLIWLPTLYISKIHMLGYSNETALVASGYLYALFQIGGLSSAFFGYLGDKLHKKSYKGRPLITALFVFLTAPFYIIMFLIPMINFYLPSESNPTHILFSLLLQIATNPFIAVMFIFSLLASAAQSANTPNWLALISEVNLPEHRSTTFSAANLANGLGRTLGNLGVGTVLTIISLYSKEPFNYIITLSLFQLFLIPSAYCYVRMAKNIETDIVEIRTTLSKRAKER